MGLMDDFFTAALPASSQNFSGGLARGVVKENWDSDHPGKLKVELFLGEDGVNVTGWIPVMTPYAGEKFGYYSLPEVGTEVIVGFTLGDRNCPVVLGCLWNAKSPPPDETANDKNEIKRMKTKGGCEIIITDTADKQKIEIKTSKSTGILIDDENNKITVNDADKKNSITIDGKAGAVTIEADKKITLKAGGSDIAVFDGNGKSVKLDSGKVELSAQSDVNVKGQNVKLDGTNVNINANAQLAAKSSGMAEIKGSMLKLN